MVDRDFLDDLMESEAIRAASGLRNEVWRDRAWKRYLGGVLVAAATFALLLALSQVVTSTYPLMTYLAASAVSAHLFGWRSALLTGVIGFLVSWYSFIVPINAFQLGPQALVALIGYSAAGTLVVSLISSLQRRNAELRVERRANQLLAQNREILFRELQHRVGNNLQIVGAMLSLQKRGLMGDAAAAVDRAAKRVQAIGTIQRDLYDPDGTAISLSSLVEKVCNDALQTTGRDDVELSFTLASDNLVEPDKAIPATLILAETIGNAIEHGLAGKSGTVWVSTAVADGCATIAVVDSGGTLPPGFRAEEARSLGMRLASVLAQQLQGEYALQGTAEQTRAVLTFPLHS